MNENNSLEIDPKVRKIDLERIAWKVGNDPYKPEMSDYEIYIAIAIMAIVNFLTRVLPFLFFRKNELPSYITFIERFFPSVIMTILIVF